MFLKLKLAAQGRGQVLEGEFTKETAQAMLAEFIKGRRAKPRDQ